MKNDLKEPESKFGNLIYFALKSLGYHSKPWLA